MDVPRWSARRPRRRAALGRARPVRRGPPAARTCCTSSGARDCAGTPGSPPSPAAKIEDSDDGPVAAALREAAEETGLDPAGVDVLATLPELFIARSRVPRSSPVLAWWRVPTAVRPVDIGEVAAVERIAVADLADPANRLMLRFPSGQQSARPSASTRC